MIKLLETRVYEGKEYVAAEQIGCDYCVFDPRPEGRTCHIYIEMPCAYHHRRESVIWLTPERAALARLRGHL